jgi:hypothetical protein
MYRTHQAIEFAIHFQKHFDLARRSPKPLIDHKLLLALEHGPCAEFPKELKQNPVRSTQFGD